METLSEEIESVIGKCDALVAYSESGVCSRVNQSTVQRVPEVNLSLC